MEYIKDTDSNKTRDIVYMSVFTAMISICSWISIPASIPFTLQTMGVFTTVGLLGGKRGTLTVLTYILLGAIGIPVFAGLTGGVSVLLGTTGGYIDVYKRQVIINPNTIMIYLFIFLFMISLHNHHDYTCLLYTSRCV